MIKRVICTANAPAAIGPYSQAIEAGNTLYISGQLPIDPSSGKLIEGDIKEQTEQVFKNIEAILNTAGYSFSQVVKCTCLLSSMMHFSGMNEVYTQYYTELPPARTTYAVKELPLGALIEIETIAIKQ